MWDHTEMRRPILGLPTAGNLGGLFQAPSVESLLKTKNSRRGATPKLLFYFIYTPADPRHGRRPPPQPLCIKTQNQWAQNSQSPPKPVVGPHSSPAPPEKIGKV